MRLVFANDDLCRLYTDANYRPRGLGPDLINACRKKLQLLAAATSEQELRQFKSLRLEKLTGDRAGQHSIRLNDKWRLILQFRTDFDGRAVIVIEIVDYH